MDAKNYSYRILWSEEDQNFVGECLEFPSLSWLAKTQIEALQGIVGLVQETLADMKANDERLPIPLTSKNKIPDLQDCRPGVLLAVALN